MRVQEILQQFGAVSYYKLNINKSCILPINISKKQISRLKERFPFQWMANPPTYLGIKIVSPSANTYDTNFTLLLDTIKTDLAYITTFELSWLGKIAALKMFPLPRIIYYFRTILYIYLNHSLSVLISFLGSLCGKAKCLKSHFPLYSGTGLQVEQAFLFFVTTVDRLYWIK